MPEPYLLHPVAVHFPIAALLLGLAAEAGGRREGATALLYFGVAALWLAYGLGWLAESTAPHVPPAWRTMNAHIELASWTAGVFTVLALWRWRFPRRAPRLFLALWLGGAGLLIATGLKGGELVFRYGVGVAER